MTADLRKELEELKPYDPADWDTERFGGAKLALRAALDSAPESDAPRNDYATGFRAGVAEYERVIQSLLDSLEEQDDS